VIDLLKALEAYGERIHVGYLIMELVSEESAEVNASFMLTLFSMDRQTEEEV
jgi:hypothetical protein